MTEHESLTIDLLKTLERSGELTIELVERAIAHLRPLAKQGFADSAGLTLETCLEHLRAPFIEAAPAAEEPIQ